MKKTKWNNRKKTALMLGRFQPWHKGHEKLFKKSLIRAQQVLIMIKNVHKIGDNPYSFSQVKYRINKAIKNKYFGRYKIVLAPNITNICYGRKVGYKIEKINLGKEIHKISATNIRKKLRSEGKI